MNHEGNNNKLEIRQIDEEGYVTYQSQLSVQFQPVGMYDYNHPLTPHVIFPYSQ